MINGKKSLLVIGQFALVFGIFGFLMNAFMLENNYYVAFVTGALLGLALVMNLAFLLEFNKNAQ